MSLFKRADSRNWQCEWRIGGKTIKESAGTADRQQAQEYHDRRRSELWRAQKFGEHTITFDTAALAWWKELASAKRSAETDRIRLRRVTEEFTGVNIATINTPALDAFAVKIAREGSKPSTVNKVLAVASGILRHSARKGWLPAMPVVPWAKVKKADYEWLTQDEAARLLALLPEHLDTLTRFALMTGLRRQNVTHLEWSRVDLERRQCWIKAEDSKNGRPLAIPLNTDAVAVLQAQQGKHMRWCFPYRGKAVMHTTTKAWKRAVEAIGRPMVTFHDMRHTWASWHIQNGTKLEELQRLGGWETLSMVMVYAHHAEGFADAKAGNVSLPNFLPASDEVLNQDFADVTQADDLTGKKMGWLMGLEPTTTGITSPIARKKAA
jgi:integrase